MFDDTLISCSRWWRGDAAAACVVGGDRGLARDTRQSSPAQAHNVLIVLIICDHLSPASPAGAVSQWARLLSHN